MKTLIWCLFLSFSWNQPTSSPATQICGRWHSVGESGEGIVEIFQDTNGKFYGKLVRVFDEKSQKMLDAELFKHQLTELMVIRDFEYLGNQTWGNGELFSPKRKQLINGTLTLRSADKLQVEGSLWGFSRSFEWRRLP